MMKQLFRQGFSLFRDACTIFLDLSKVLVPALIAVKLLQVIGVISYLSILLEPFMGLFGLPGELALVWTTAIATNIYGGIAVLMMFVDKLQLTVAQMTTISLLILICHSLPVELALTQRVGARCWFIGPFRFLGACCAGYLLRHAYSLGEALSLGEMITVGASPSSLATIRWVAPEPEVSLFDWARNQTYNLGFILLVIFCLLTLMRLFKYLGVTSFLARILRPLLVLMGISEKGASIAVFGLLAGITFGSGLLLAEAKESSLSQRDVVLILAFLSLCHGVIEDTTLMLLIGADLGGILVFRLLFTVVVVAILARLRGTVVESAHSPGRPVDVK